MSRVSERFGRLVIRDSPEQQSVAARIGSAAFLDPLMLTWPESSEGPVMMRPVPEEEALTVKLCFESTLLWWS